jgi:hypothetical protein
MHITLDGEQWQLPDDTSLMNALAFLSDKAHAQHRIVTSLTVGGRSINDRDLDPVLFESTGTRCGRGGRTISIAARHHHRCETGHRSVCRAVASRWPGPARPATFGHRAGGNHRFLVGPSCRLYGNVGGRTNAGCGRTLIRSAPPMDTGTPGCANLRRSHPRRGSVGV